MYIVWLHPLSIIMEISKHKLAELLRDRYKLEALENYGVDNWSWYNDAMSDSGEGTFPSVIDVYEWDDDKVIEELW